MNTLAVSDTADELNSIEVVMVATQLLAGVSVVGCDCEGRKLSHDGQLSLVDGHDCIGSAAHLARGANRPMKVSGFGRRIAQAIAPTTPCALDVRADHN